jgi:hypothetical protein
MNRQSHLVEYRLNPYHRHCHRYQQRLNRLQSNFGYLRHRQQAQSHRHRLNHLHQLQLYNYYPQ